MKIKEGNEEDLDEDSTVKITIPKRLHIKLHSKKVLTGMQISEIATEALEAYFEDEEP